MSNSNRMGNAKAKSPTAIDRELEGISEQLLSSSKDPNLRAEFDRLLTIRRESIFSGNVRGRPHQLRLRREEKETF